MNTPNEVKPLSSTQRVVEWDELPASVREIPASFTPELDSVLMKHQVQWCQTRASIVVAEKGRRTGITFAEALYDTTLAAARKSAGGTNVFYVGDTKDKGLEFIGYCAHFARVIVSAQNEGVSHIEEFLFEDQEATGKIRHITAYRIRFASGFQIVALSSNPSNIRGLQGLVVIDEAAFHANVQGVLDSATALLIWGGQIRVISTHNGKKNPFNELIRDIEAGRYGDDAKVVRVSFDDAVANGLYERVCVMKGETPTADKKIEWYQRIRNAYGPRKAAMREELDVIPRDGSSVCIPGVWIERAMTEERPVVRLTLDDDFIHRSEYERSQWCKTWMTTYLDPVIEQLDPTLRHVFGYDFARHRHFSVFVPMAIQQNLSRKVPFIIEMNNVPAALQEQIALYLISKLPRQSGGAVDATGPGMVLAEYIADKFGRPRIAEVTLSRTWYGQWMPKFTGAFEDGTIDLPRDANIEQDMRAIEENNGIQMVAKLERKDLKEPELVRHGDSAIACALAWYATLNLTAEIEYESTGVRGVSLVIQDFDRSTETNITDKGFGTVSGINRFEGYV